MSDTSSRIPNKSVYTVTPTAQIGLSLWNTKGDAEKSYKSVNEKVGLKANVAASEKIDVYVAASAAFSQSSKNLEQPSTDGVKTAVVNTVGAEYEQGVAFKLGDATSLSLGTYAEAGVANGTAPLLAGSSSLVDLKGYHGVGLSTAFAYHSEKSTISLVGKFGGRSYSFHKANSFVSATTGLNWGLGINWSGQVKRKDNEELQEDVPSASLEERDPIVEPEGTTPTPMAAAPVAAEPIEPTPAAAAEPVAAPATPTEGAPATPEPTPAAAATPPTSSATPPPAAAQASSSSSAGSQPAKPAAPAASSGSGESTAPKPATPTPPAAKPASSHQYYNKISNAGTMTLVDKLLSEGIIADDYSLTSKRTMVGYVAIKDINKAVDVLSGKDTAKFKAMSGATSANLAGSTLNYSLFKGIYINYSIVSTVTRSDNLVKISWVNGKGANSFTENKGYWSLKKVEGYTDLWELTWYFTTTATVPGSAIVESAKKQAPGETKTVFQNAINILSKL